MRLPEVALWNESIPLVCLGLGCALLVCSVPLSLFDDASPGLRRRIHPRRTL